MKGADQIIFSPGLSINVLVPSPASSNTIFSTFPFIEYSKILILPIVELPDLTHLISKYKGSFVSIIGKLSIFLLRASHSVQLLPSLDIL